MTGVTCRACGQVGRVRVEIVIKADKVERRYHCGACGDEWTEAEQEPEHSPARRKTSKA